MGQADRLDFDHPTARDRELMSFTLVRAADRFQSIADQALEMRRSDGFDEKRAAGIYGDVAVALRSWAASVVRDEPETGGLKE